MTRRRLLLFGPLAIVAGVAIGVWLLWPRTITRERFDEIAPGMTLGQVEAILGGRARDESDRHLVGDFIKNSTRERINEDETFKVWATDWAGGAVVFDARQRVVRAIPARIERSPESTVEVFRRWLRL